MSEIPRGWMDAETARKRMARGTWAWRTRGDTDPDLYLSNSGNLPIEDGESWKFLAPHPDDEPAAGTVEIEASRDPVALVRAALVVAYDIVTEYAPPKSTPSFPYEYHAQIAAMLIRAGFESDEDGDEPTPEAVETVVGVCRE